MMQLNMIGGGFQHDICSSAHNTPKHIEWNKTNQASISVHIDNAVFDIPVNSHKTNIAWFAESPYFTRNLTYRLDTPHVKRDMLDKFKFIFSCDKQLIAKHPEIKYVIPTACPWIKNRKIYAKSKSISIIASAKCEAPGHILRHMIIKDNQSQLDIFGGGYNPIENKEIGLNDYLFSFAIENFKTDGYFTEKITDCFATGTIPIYWGDPCITEYFIEDGIINLNDEFTGDYLTLDFYNSKRLSIEENYRRAMELPTAEDYIYLNYLKYL